MNPKGTKVMSKPKNGGMGAGFYVLLAIVVLCAVMLLSAP
jgi:hypothetical protein